MDRELEYQQDVYKKILGVSLRKEEDWMKLSSYLVSHGDVLDEQDHNVLMNLTMWNFRIIVKKIMVFVGIPFYFHKFGFPDTPNKMLKALGITYVAIPFLVKSLEEQYYVDQIQQILVFKYKNLICLDDQ